MTEIKITGAETMKIVDGLWCDCGPTSIKYNNSKYLEGNNDWPNVAVIDMNDYEKLGTNIPEFRRSELEAIIIGKKGANFKRMKPPLIIHKKKKKKMLDDIIEQSKFYIFGKSKKELYEYIELFDNHVLKIILHHSLKFKDCEEYEEKEKSPAAAAAAPVRRAPAMDGPPQEYETYLDENTGHHRLKGGALLIRDPTPEELAASKAAGEDKQVISAN